MQITIHADPASLSDPKARVLALEAATRAICEQAKQDPADGTMMLLTAAVHLATTYSSAPLRQTITTLSECLGHAIVAADDFFTLKEVDRFGDRP